MQTVNRSSGPKRWTQKRKGGITNMVAKAKLTLERLASVDNSRGSDVTVSKLKQNSALSSQLPESTNYKVIHLRHFCTLTV